MERSKVPSPESILNLIEDFPPAEIDVICLRIMTTDKAIHHWHYRKDEWVQAIGTQG